MTADAGSVDGGQGEEMTGGCGCTALPAPALWLAAAAVLLRRRRRA
jgi:uncharacterized protein (TIGR03382 family)